MTTIAQEEVLRRMKLAQALREQANAPIQADPRGAVSWTQGLAKILQNVGAARQESRAMEDAKALRAQRQQALAAAMQLPPDQQAAALMGVEGFEDTGAKLMIESSRNKQLADALTAAAKGNPDIDPGQLAARTKLGGADAAFGYLDRMTPTPAQERDYRFKVDERDYTRGRDATEDALKRAELADKGVVLPDAAGVPASGSLSRDDVLRIIAEKVPDATPQETALALATIQEESAFNPGADSGKATGIAQFTPETGARYGLTPENFNDPEAQIPAMIQYQRDLAKEAGGFSPYAIAAGYHAGEGGLRTGEGVGPKTTSYAARVNQAYKERLQEIEAMKNAGVISPSQARDATASAKKDAAAQVKDEIAQEKPAGDQFLTLSADEVKALGMPAGTVAQRNANTGKIDIISDTRNRPSTMEERMAGGYATRMEKAEQEIADIGTKGLPTWNTKVASHAPVVGDSLERVVMTPDQQSYRQAQEDWVRAKLRKESGAVIATEEMDKEITTYFPVPGDSQKVIDQKAESRKTAIQALKDAAGPGLNQDAKPAEKPKRKRWDPDTETLVDVEP